MKIITVLSTVLLGCLLVITVQGVSSVPTGTVEYKNKLGVAAQEEAFVRSEGGHVRKIGVGGKKFSREEVKYVADGEASKISGATYSDGICNDNDGLKPSESSPDQNNEAQKPKQYLKSSKFVIRRSVFSSTNPKSCSQDCNSVAPKSDLGSFSNPEQGISEEAAKSSGEKDETQRFSEAAKEIASLIYKDYKGKPSHRPPINNQEPRN
ncbi:hypothetical protein DEO72_LG10g4007 [Vigna unguiculata]|uniref:Uncharacterized protein n=2 Tax=Vigna unguiculata TaxID=3917 RepID=A0A4D6NLJ6_VIGUN|nr:hypothetical protein DEO72_LG10g4007 [Vigna unguiculata]